jgi:predicted Zn-dependent protease
MMSPEDFERHIRAARGYLELGMHEDALGELEGLPVDELDRPQAVEMRLAVLIGNRRWPEALVTARRLCSIEPEKPFGYIHAAFCLHEMGRTREAREFILAGPPALAREPLYYYNLACYDAILGHGREACDNLHRSFRLDARLKDYAREDPDLDSIRGQIELC